jgi:hypothetical protein
MTEVVRIGASLHSGKPHPTRRLVLPAKLDLEACLKVLETYDPDWVAADIKAAAKPLELDRVDAMLEVSEQSTSDRMRFKQALTYHGLLSRGKRAY